MRMLTLLYSNVKVFIVTLNIFDEFCAYWMDLFPSEIVQ